MGSKFAIMYRGDSPIQTATKKYRRKLLVRIQYRALENCFPMAWKKKLHTGWFTITSRDLTRCKTWDEVSQSDSCMQLLDR